MQHLKGYFLYIFIFTFSTSAVFAQKSQQKDPEFLQYQNSAWVDSVMKILTPDERIAQLIMVAAFSNKDEAHKQEILELIINQKIGGLLFFQGGPVRQVRLMNVYQAYSKVPLIGAIDAEWGLGMRLDTTVSYPYQMALGAIQNDSLIYKMGTEVARQIKRSGLHMNFAPVVDVNNNANNPVINFRSFGEDKYNVAKKGIAYMRGLQDEKVLPTAKHFPGHGDTDVDSHYALPQINHSLARLDSIELYPFKEIIKAGIGGIMIAHLDIPALDSTGVPSTLSNPIVTGLLKEKLNFKGLIVTDAMNMKGVTKDNPPGIVDKTAILAGNGLLEYTEDVPKAIAEIRQAINAGLITQEEIDTRARKILAVKQWAGLNDYKPVSLLNLSEEITTSEAELLNRQLTEASLTVLKNDNNILPLQNLGNLKIATVSIGKPSVTTFQETISLYTGASHFQLPFEASAGKIDSLKQQLTNYNFIIAGVHDESRFPRNSSKFSEAVKNYLSELALQRNSVIAFFKNPYVLDKLSGIENSPALLLTYQDSKNAQDLAAQLIFGGIGANGKLPVSIGNKFKAGIGINVYGGIRFKYTLPEEAGMDSQILYRGIDSLMQEAMMVKAIPGGQVLVAKDQKIVFHKAYGYHSYSDTVQVKTSDLYDLASVTKISSALPALMKLYEEDKIDLDRGLGTYLPSFRRSNKANIPLRQILAHQAGLQAWIPFWKNTLRNNGSYKWSTFKKDSSARYPVKVTEEMWLHRKYKNKILQEIRKSPVSAENKYVYSDLGFYLFPFLVENVTGENFVQYLNSEFYNPLGATSLTYRPLQKYPRSKIVPTENDYLFRKIPIHGTVHDEGAIMMGGVSGHAGLFSNANDLAKLMQMYLNKGAYGGREYIEEEVLEEFSKYQFPENDNRRGLGFDKPALGERKVSGNTAIDASESSFGHTGFTGTMVWMDPETDLLYIFLSNRVLPTRENTRLYRLNTRTNIQQVLYNSMKAEGSKTGKFKD